MLVGMYFTCSYLHMHRGESQPCPRDAEKSHEISRPRDKVLKLLYNLHFGGRLWKNTEPPHLAQCFGDRKFTSRTDHFPTDSKHGKLKFFIVEKDQFVPHVQYHRYWWTSRHRQGISSYSIVLVIPDDSDFSTGRDYIMSMRKFWCVNIYK